MFGHDNNQQQNDMQGHPGAPIEPAADGVLSQDDTAAVAPPTLSDTPPSENVSDAPSSLPSPAPTTDVGDTLQPSGDDALLTIKQQALQQLSPLVGHLDQSPEEKFRTTMMMIQAADDQALVKDAYDAAQKITDEKARAQALLDIVNEINYFTQQHTS